MKQLDGIRTARKQTRPRKEERAASESGRGESKSLQESDRVLNDELKRQAVETFHRFLAHGHYRSTPERHKILESVLNRVGHFNADELYASMVVAKLSISRATVYSTLELLEKAGLIIKHNFRSGRSYYEVGFDEPHHDHLICVRCGHISEFVHPQLLSIRKQVADKVGMKVVDHSFQIFAECQKPDNCPYRT